VSGCFNFNNPARELIKEACDLYQINRPVASLLSLGCGRREAVRVPEPSNDVNLSTLLESVASDCEVVAEDLHWWIGSSGVYHRFSVDQVLLPQDKIVAHHAGEILSHTSAYLAKQRTSEAVDRWVAVSERYGRVTLGDICERLYNLEPGHNLTYFSGYEGGRYPISLWIATLVGLFY
jgi:hypothetical protein